MGNQLDHDFYPQGMTLDRRTLLAVGLASLTIPVSIAKANIMTSPKISVLELRQYTLKKGRRDELITLFEREFVEPLNAAGGYVLGTYRDVDDCDRFVWLRGFENMAKRAEALTDFYGGAVWSAHRNAANETMLDSDNVLLLQVAPQPLDIATFRTSSSHGIVTAHVHYLGVVSTSEFSEFFDTTMRPMLGQLGATPFATMLSGDGVNNFPRLPVRENEPVFVWLSKWDSEAEVDAFEARFANLSGWRDAATEAILPALARKAERLRLRPTNI